MSWTDFTMMKTPYCRWRLHSSSFLASLLICMNSISLKYPSATPTFGNETDQLALLAFKNYLVDRPNGVLSSWNDSLPFCQWQGITCGRRHQRVTVLRLDGQGLSGSLPPLGNLTFLRRINFCGNKLQGTIPREIGRLSRLEYLNLTDNSLGGEIPVELANCSNLDTIALSQNNLTGNIPFEIGFLSKLLVLWFPVNNLTGSIPSSIGNLSSLSIVSFAENNLVGSIPHDLGGLQSMKRLRLYANNLSGMIPFSLYNLSSLYEFTVAENNLSGNIMPDTGLNIPNLRALILGYNRFTGLIPASISNISKLVTFDAPSNNLSGQVPNSLGMLRDLQWFNVEFNGLGSGKSGDLTFLSNISSVEILGLKSNRFGGALPNSFFNHSTQLTRLTLGSNQISGNIPEGIGNLINLIQLGMEENYLTGMIPTSIVKLQNLEKLDFTQNRLSGLIPSSLGNLTRLFYLSLADNNLEGNIPSSLKYCQKLQTLLLQKNKLSGHIPQNLISQFYQLITLYLYQNSLTGSFPQDVGILKNLGELAISDNKLSGEIPVELGNCLGLEYLSLAGNLLEGGIPPSLSYLKAIRLMDLSRNNLSGTIPEDLQNLSALKSFNLSFNHLEGEVPTRGVFSNASEISLTGNLKLCGGIPQLQLPVCPGSKSGKHGKSLSTKAIIAITISSAVLLALILACIILYTSRRQKTNSSSASTLGDGYLRISYRELLEATERFSPSNLVGVGSFGSVYRGYLGTDKTPVAVKVLNLQKSGGTKSFLAECRSLGRIRHRNLLKIITSCSSVDFKGNDFMALVFELMPNGSLENWLHEQGSLNLGQRLDIAIDVASALEYLHYHCQTPIVHCDLKPSNVLLDNDMVAHVGDFGLARLLYGANGNSSQQQSYSSTLKGSVGYVAPEYGMGGNVSLQGDVYSYGILLLEMITGKRPTDDMFKDGVSLHSFSKMALPERAMEILDSSLLIELEEANNNAGNEGNVKGEMWECLVSIAGIGVACSFELPSERMDIQDVLKELHAIKKKFLQARQT